MSHYSECRGDRCASPRAARNDRPVSLFGPRLPKGWKRYGDTDCCSYDCLIEHLQELKRKEAADRIFSAEPTKEKDKQAGAIGSTS